MSAASLSIILATFNGAQYLQQQLESLADQTCLPTELIVGDDGSLDTTNAIVEEFAKTSPFVVRWIDPCKEPLGACANFARLLEHASGDYVLFCDQDDIWLPDKICLTLEEMQRLEAMYSIDTPCLVHTDLKVISESGAEIAPSFWHYQRLKPWLGTKLQVVLAQNLVTGCTVMLNRAAIHRIGSIPRQGPLMHDWWFSLVVVAFGGQISALDSATVLYRQHACNAVGAHPWWQRIVHKLFSPDSAMGDEVRATQRQATAFLDHFGLDIPEKSRLVIQKYAGLSGLGFFARRALLWRHGIHKSGWYRTLGLYLRV